MADVPSYKTICVTGHRPQKLYGFDIGNPKWTALKEKLKTLLLDNGCTTAVTGMALGVDMIFAIAVCELKDAGYDIKLHCAIPCLEHTKKWEEIAKDGWNETTRNNMRVSILIYQKILEYADVKKIVTEQPYEPWMMDARNRYMVDMSDAVIAVWDGSPGGTGNCVRYAEKKNKPIIRVIP